MSAARSIRGRLALSLVGGFALLGLVAGVGLYLGVRHVLVGQFDQTMTEKAKAIAGEVDFEPGGPELELSYTLRPEFASAGRPQYFQIRHADGSTFARSPSLNGRDLAGPAEGAFGNTTLPDGREGRAVLYHFTPQTQEREHPGFLGRSGPMTLVFARDRRSLDRALLAVSLGLLGSGVLLCAGTAGVILLALRRGLRPLADVASRADAMDPASAAFLLTRFPTDDLPAELRPICLRLNDLLDRTAAVLARQRRFTADAAHELRTPLAELRTTAEVALRWPGDAEESRRAMADVLAATLHMQRLSGALLELARGSAGKVEVRSEPVDLAAAVCAALNRHRPGAAARSIAVRCPDGQPAVVRSDPTLLAAVVENLVANAVSHTADGGRVDCSVRRDGEVWSLRIANAPADVEAADLPHLAEPFWQKADARGGGSGLGLSLVAGYVEAVGGKLTLSVPAAGAFEARVDWPAAAPPACAGTEGGLRSEPALQPGVPPCDSAPSPPCSPSPV